MCPECKCIKYQVKFVFKHLKMIRVQCTECDRIYYLDKIDESGWKQQQLIERSVEDDKH